LFAQKYSEFRIQQLLEERSCKSFAVNMILVAVRDKSEINNEGAQKRHFKKDWQSKRRDSGSIDSEINAQWISVAFGIE
jgi:hypothetical protein